MVFTIVSFLWIHHDYFEVICHHVSNRHYIMCHNIFWDLFSKSYQSDAECYHYLWHNISYSSVLRHPNMLPPLQYPRDSI